MHRLKNFEIAKILYEMAVLMEMKEVQFKPRAFEKAASAIEALDKELFDIYKEGGLKALEDVPGVGTGIAERIEELFKTGHLKEYEKLKKQIPVDLEGLTKIEGIGPKMVLKLYKKLGIKTIGQLEKAAKAGKIRKLAGFGEKTEVNILQGIEFQRKSKGRFLLGYIWPTVKEILDQLRALPEVEQIEVAGSVRRKQETVGDADILITSKKPEKVMDFFVSMPEAVHVYAKGPTRSAVRLKIGMDADLRVLDPESYGSALQYFTGDKAHNIQLRKIAIDFGYKLNEYGLFKGAKRIAGKTEEEIYKALEMDWMPPELRTASGEIEAAQKHDLPKLIEYDDLKGDLQVQTNWTDGANSIKEMARAAKELGLEYIVITDHTKSLAMTGGSDEAQLEKQGKEIDKLNKEIKGIKILKGAEVNILKDGSLDISDEALAKLDVVGATVHSNFNMSRAEMTERIIKTMKNPHVDIIFHLTGRLLQKREGYEVDFDKILKAAKETGTVIEINAFPERLDIKDEMVRRAVEAGVKMSIDSDAHAVSHFRYLEYGIGQARRGWATKNDIINAWPLEKMLGFLKDHKIRI